MDSNKNEIKKQLTFQVFLPEVEGTRVRGVHLFTRGGGAASIRVCIPAAHVQTDCSQDGQKKKVGLEWRHHMTSHSTEEEDPE